MEVDLDGRKRREELGRVKMEETVTLCERGKSIFNNRKT